MGPPKGLWPTSWEPLFYVQCVLVLIIVLAHKHYKLYDFLNEETRASLEE